MILDFQVIPHKKQRYDTAGDYFLRKGRWIFTISKMKDKRYPVLVFLHEVIEFFMCRLLGISVAVIDRFDMAYERSRNEDHAPCGCQHYDEPGDDPHSPYHRPHVVSTQCERLICEGVGINWEKYCEVVEAL